MTWPCIVCFACRRVAAFSVEAHTKLEILFLGKQGKKMHGSSFEEIDVLAKQSSSKIVSE